MTMPIYKLIAARILQNLAILSSFLCVLAAYVFFATFGNFNWHSSDNHSHSYALLTDGFLKGHTFLDIEPDPKLLRLQNPYNRDARNGIAYPWDSSFYKEKFYYYFTPIPAIIVFVPYFLLTGKHAPEWLAGTLFAWLSIVILYNLTVHLSPKIKTTWKKCILIFILGLGTPALYSLSPVKIYQTAIFTIMFINLILIFLLIKTEVPTRNKLLLFLIGCIMPIVIFGRPQVLLAVSILLAFMKFHNKTKEELLYNIRYISYGFIPIFSCFAIYNYVRFENCLQIGNYYGLTIKDLTSIKYFEYNSIINFLERIPHYFFAFFLHPPEFLNLFPFVHPTPPSSVAVHSIYRPPAEPMLGLLFSLPIFLLSMIVLSFLFFKRFLLRHKFSMEIIKLPCVLFLSGLSVVLLDSFYGFLVHRYVLDSYPFFIVGSILLLTSFMKNYSVRPILKYIAIIFLSVQMLLFNVLPAFYGNFNDFIRFGNQDLIQLLRKSISLNFL
jgi:hypothetical protein